MDMKQAKDQEVVKDFKRVEQYMKILLGQVGADTKPLSSLRRGELLPLASQTMKSEQLLAAPTMADFNALQADIQMIFDALSLISNRNGNAKLPGI